MFIRLAGGEENQSINKQLSAPASDQLIGGSWGHLMTRPSLTAVLLFVMTAVTD